MLYEQHFSACFSRTWVTCTIFTTVHKVNKIGISVMVSAHILQWQYPRLILVHHQYKDFIFTQTVDQNLGAFLPLDASKPYELSHSFYVVE